MFFEKFPMVHRELCSTSLRTIHERSVTIYPIPRRILYRLESANVSIFLLEPVLTKAEINDVSNI
jgi:hypothetical protein